METTTRLHIIAYLFIVMLHRKYNKCIYKSIFLSKLNILISKNICCICLNSKMFSLVFNGVMKERSVTEKSQHKRVKVMGLFDTYGQIRLIFRWNDIYSWSAFLHLSLSISNLKKVRECYFYCRSVGYTGGKICSPNRWKV